MNIYSSNNKLFLVSLAFILLFIINIFHSTWWVNGPNVIDPFIYWGTSQNYEYFKYHFSDSYYFRRWMLIYPLIFMQYFFDAGVAKFLLANLFLFVVLLLVLKICKDLFGDYASGIFVCVVMGFNQYILNVIQMEHVTNISVLITIITFSYLFTVIDTNNFIHRKHMFFLFLLSQSLIISFPLFIFFSVSLAGTFWLMNSFYFQKNIFKEFLFITLLFSASLISIILFDLIVFKIQGINLENIISFSLGVQSGFQLEGSSWKTTFTSLQFERFIHRGTGWVYALTSIVLVFYFILKNEIKDRDKLLKITSLILILIFLFIYYFVFTFFRDIPRSIYMHPSIFLYLIWVITLPIVVININNYAKILIFSISFCLIFIADPVMENYVSRSYIGITVLLLVGIYVFLLRNNSVSEELYLKEIMLLIVLVTATLMWAWNHKSFMDTPTLFYPKQNIFKEQQRTEMIEKRKYPINFNDMESLSEYSDELKEITKYIGYHRIFIVDLRPSKYEWSLLESAMYGMWSMIHPRLNKIYNDKVKNNDLSRLDCALLSNQIYWMESFNNPIIVIFGTETISESKEFLQDITSHCEINYEVSLSSSEFKIGHAFEGKIIIQN